MFSSLLAKLVLSSTIYFTPAPVQHAYTATVETSDILASLDRATAVLDGAK